MKIWTKIEWTIIVASSVLLLLLFILFGYSHPQSDDFSYNFFMEQKGFWGAVKYIFNNNSARFFSTIVILFSPLQHHNIIGYQCYTAILFLFFLLSLFSFFSLILHPRISKQNTLALFAYTCLCFCAFAPNLHEFAYWLFAEATYLLGLSLWLWAIILHYHLSQKKFENNILIWLLCTLNTIAIVGCSEAAMILYIVPIVFHFWYRHTILKQHHRGLYAIAIIYILTVIFVVSALGNYNRHTLTPFSGNLLLALSRGLYAAGYWLSKWTILFVPIICFYILVFGLKLLNWSAQIPILSAIKAKTIFIISILFFVFTQILVVWMSGSKPEARFENVLFLFLLLSFLFAAQLMIQEQAAFFALLKGNIYRGFKTLSFLYLACLFMVVPNNVVNALLDVLSGAAKGYDLEQNKRYSSLAQSTDSIAIVTAISYHPYLLYHQTVSCNKAIDDNDIPRLSMADYFGKKWIYEYPCTSEAKELSIKEVLKQKRVQFFSNKKK
ncbi:MAG: hypothetical protein QM530_04810 [Phycisphaerales bacterium]|nr:hypothetical protein [Phycisphaerales bacterium]